MKKAVVKESQTMRRNISWSDENMINDEHVSYVYEDIVQGCYKEEEPRSNMNGKITVVIAQYTNPTQNKFLASVDARLKPA